MAKLDKIGAVMIFLLLAFALVCCSSVEGIILGFSLSNVLSSRICKKHGKDNNKLVIEGLGGIRGLRC